MTEYTKMEWLEDRLRHVRLVRSNGEDPDEGMLVGVFALWGHHQVEFKAPSLEAAIEMGVAYENRHHEQTKIKGGGCPCSCDDHVRCAKCCPYSE